jgi:hypothetical protein
MREGLQRRQGLCLLRAPKNWLIFGEAGPVWLSSCSPGPLKKNARKELKAVKA